MDLAGLIDTYGYYAVLVGAFLEGETVLALAGLAAYRGYLDFYTVVVVALAAGFAGDQTFFWLGRLKGREILARFPQADQRAQRFDAHLRNWHAPLIVAVRFMYGFRILGPMLLGMGRVSTWKFIVFNFLGACIWAPLIAGIGYTFGGVIETVMHDLKHFELAAFAAIIVFAAVVGVVAYRRQAKLDDKVARDARRGKNAESG
jgi:membrane protein DedA with SNARE-associated domain